MRDFTKEQSGMELSLFLAPMLFSVTFQRIYSLVNTAVVSQYLSYEAVAVIGACQAYQSMQEFIFMGMTTGFGFYIFRCVGRKGTDALRTGFWGAVWLTGLLALTGAALPVFSRFFTELANIPRELQEDAGKYLFFLMAGSGFLGLKNLLYCTIQGLGDSSFPGLISMAGVVTQTGMTVCLIAGLRLGVGASALAVLLNNALLCVCLGVYLFRNCRERMGYAGVTEIPSAVWKELLNSGFVKSGMMILIGFGTFVMQRAVNRMPGSMIAAHTYASTIANFFMYLISAYGTAAGVIAGQNRGDGQTARLRRYNQRLFARCGCMCVWIFLFLWGWGGWALRLLAGSGASAQVIDAGIQWLRICSFGYPGLALLLICRNVLQAMGEHRFLPALGIAEMLVNIVMSLFVSAYGHMAVSISVVLKWTVPGLFSYIGYRRSIRRLSAKRPEQGRR